MARTSSRPSRTYPSKIDVWIAGLMVFGILAMLSAPVTAFLKTNDPRSLLVGFAVAPAVGFVVWILLRTNYTLESRELIVRSGPFRWRIDLSEITSISPARSVSIRLRRNGSSPALSIDRLEIVYGARSKRLLISPAEQDKFLKDIAARRPGT